MSEIEVIGSLDFARRADLVGLALKQGHKLSACRNAVGLSFIRESRSALAV
jgi:hypothetical protein